MRAARATCQVREIWKALRWASERDGAAMAWWVGLRG